MVDKKIDEKEALELKKIYNLYIDKRSKIMKNTQFKVEDVFGNIINKDKFSHEQVIKLNNFSAKIIKFTLFKPRKKSNSDYQPSAPPYYE